MTRNEVSEHLCETVAMVYETIGNFTRPSDGFCPKCQEYQSGVWNFQHAGWTLAYVRNAVRAQLIADGFTPVEKA